MRRLAAGYAGVCAIVWIAVWSVYRTPSFAPLLPSERAAIIARVRRGEPMPEPKRIVAGATFVRKFGDRIKGDVVMARAPIVAGWAPLFALSLVAGLDGIGVDVDEREAFLLPDELLGADALAGDTPLSAMDLELGAKRDVIDGLLAKQLGLDDAAFARAHKRYFRFRTDAFIESADHEKVLPVVRGNTPGPALSAAALRDGAIAGGRYLLRHLYDDGRFGYEYTPASDRDEAYGLDYSLPRHAGATYFLAQIYGATHEREFRDGARRALDFLVQRQPDHCSDPARSCIANPDLHLVDLGAAAMALLAVGEYESATGERAELPWARRLAGVPPVHAKARRRLLPPLQPDRPTQRDEKTHLLYFTGEAAFALAKLAALVGPGDRRLRALGGRARSRARVPDRQAVREPRRPVLLRRGSLDLHGRRRRRGTRCRRRIARSTRASATQFAAFLRRTQFTPRDAVARGAARLRRLLRIFAVPAAARDAGRQPLGDDHFHLRHAAPPRPGRR